MAVNLKFVLALIITVFPIFALSQTPTNKNRLEEFLIWKMSDELKLTSKEEKEFSKIIKELNAKKNILNIELTTQLKKISEIKDSTDRKKVLKSYRKSLVEYNGLSVEEFDRMQVLLGDERLSSYLLFKQDLGDKLKNMLTNSEAQDPKQLKELPEPKVIREK